MIYSSEPKSRTNDLEFPVSVVRQVPQMHKVLVNGLSIYLQNRWHKNPLSFGTDFGSGCGTTLEKPPESLCGTQESPEKNTPTHPAFTYLDSNRIFHFLYQQNQLCFPVKNNTSQMSVLLLIIIIF